MSTSGLFRTEGNCFPVCEERVWRVSLRLVRVSCLFCSRAKGMPSREKKVTRLCTTFRLLPDLRGISIHMLVGYSPWAHSPHRLADQLRVNGLRMCEVPYFSSSFSPPRPSFPIFSPINQAMGLWASVDKLSADRILSITKKADILVKRSRVR